jgi:hypothetical protein
VRHSINDLRSLSRKLDPQVVTLFSLFPVVSGGDLPFASGSPIVFVRPNAAGGGPAPVLWRCAKGAMPPPRQLIKQTSYADHGQCQSSYRYPATLNERVVAFLGFDPTQENPAVSG